MKWWVQTGSSLESVVAAFSQPFAEHFITTILSPSRLASALQRSHPMYSGWVCGNGGWLSHTCVPSVQSVILLHCAGSPNVRQPLNDRKNMRSEYTNEDQIAQRFDKLMAKAKLNVLYDHCTGCTIVFDPPRSQRAPDGYGLESCGQR